MAATQTVTVTVITGTQRETFTIEKASDVKFSMQPNGNFRIAGKSEGGSTEMKEC